MSDELLKWNCHKNLFENIYCSYINQEMLDVTLALRNGFIQVHGLILSAGSRYFRKILNKDLSESRKCIVIERVSMKIMHYLLELMYKGQVTVPKRDSKDVIDAAAFYQVSDISKCIQSADMESQGEYSTPEIIFLSDESSRSPKHSKDVNTSAGKSHNIDDPEKLPIFVLDDSDDIRSLQEPCTSLQAKQMEIPQQQSYRDNSGTASAISQDLCEEVQSQNENDRIQSKFQNFLSTDEESVTSPTFNVARRRRRLYRRTSESPKQKRPAEKSLPATKPSKHKKLLLKAPLDEMHHLCTLCLTSYDDIITHIKTKHRKMIKMKTKCEFCGNLFYNISFLDPGNHKCTK